MDKKQVLIMQILMTFGMSLTMSTIMYIWAVGPADVTAGAWLRNWLIAWPLAFVMTQIVSRIAFPLSGLLRRKLG